MGLLGCMGCAHLGLGGLPIVDFHLFGSQMAPALVIPMWHRVWPFKWDPDLAI